MFPPEKYPPPAPIPPDPRGDFHKLFGFPFADIFQPRVGRSREETREAQRQALNFQVPMALSELSREVQQSQEEVTAARVEHATTTQQLHDAQVRHDLAVKARQQADYNGPLSTEPRIPSVEDAALKAAALFPGIRTVASVYTWGKYTWNRVPATLEERDAARAMDDARGAERASERKAIQAEARHDTTLTDTEARAKVVYGLYHAHVKRE